LGRISVEGGRRRCGGRASTSAQRAQDDGVVAPGCRHFVVSFGTFLLRIARTLTTPIVPGLVTVTWIFAPALILPLSCLIVTVPFALRFVILRARFAHF
jgi:hypothetical protein